MNLLELKLSKMLLEQAVTFFPIKLYWHGWETDTYTLKRQGWDVMASEQRSLDQDGHHITIACTSPNRDFSIIGQHLISYRILCSGSYNPVKELGQSGVKMQGFKSSDRVMTYQQPISWIEDINSCSSFDGLAYLTCLTTQSIKLKDLSIFKYDQPKEIIIPYSSLDDCLNRALQLQHPQQELIKKEKPELIKPLVAQAKIYTLAA